VFSPSGKFLVSANSGFDTINIFETIQLSLQRQLKNQKKVQSVSISSDEKRLIAAADEKEIYVWNFPDGTLQGTLSYDSRFNSIRYSPDGRQFAVVGSRIVLFDNDTLKPVDELYWKEFNNEIAFSPDGKHIVAATGLTFELFRNSTKYYLHVWSK
jgi:WD40 repeat protein